MRPKEGSPEVGQTDSSLEDFVSLAAVQAAILTGDGSSQAQIGCRGDHFTSHVLADHRWSPEGNSPSAAQLFLDGTQLISGIPCRRLRQLYGSSSRFDTVSLCDGNYLYPPTRRELSLVLC